MSATVATVIATTLTVLPFTTGGQRSGSATARLVLIPVSDLLATASGETIAGGPTGLSEGGAPGSSQATGAGGAKPTISEVSDITHSDDKLALAGRPASFGRVKIQRVAGVRSFWAGDSRTQRVFVVVDAVDLKQAVGSDRGLRDGDIVALDGTLERVPGTLGQVTVTSWGRLDDKDAKALSERDVYVFAKHVTVLSRAGE